MHKAYNQSLQFLAKYKADVSASLQAIEDMPNSLKCFTTYIIEHLYDESLTVTDAKRECNITNRNFASRFYLYVGNTPKNFILGHRINAAKYLLRETDHSIAEISILVGFSTHSAFSKAFKKRLGGVCPSDW